MKEKTTFKLKNLFDGKTPKRLVKLGNALSITGIFLLGYSFIKEDQTLTYWLVAIAGLGKFITELFSEK